MDTYVRLDFVDHLQLDRLVGDDHTERVVVPVARFAPVTATAVSLGMLVGEAVCTILIDQHCTQPLLCAQL